MGVSEMELLKEIALYYLIWHIGISFIIGLFVYRSDEKWATSFYFLCNIPFAVSIGIGFFIGEMYRKFMRYLDNGEGIR
jgi:hypothetical protein